jgi:hypothetical protein
MALEPIEPHIRSGPGPNDEALIVRGGPLRIEKLVEHARRQERRYSYGGQAMASVSVDVVLPGWTLESILGERLFSRSTYGTCLAGQLQQQGFVLLATHDDPHFDILLLGEMLPAAERLLAILEPSLDNPYKRRR